MYRSLILCLLLILPACGSGEAETNNASSENPDESSEAGDGATESAPASVGLIHLPEQLKDFDMDAVVAAWQGDWVVRNQGQKEAWHVEGQALTTFQNGKESSKTLDFYGPCKAGATSSNDRGTVSEIVSFGIVDGRIVQDNAVVRQGDKIVGCDSKKLIYFDGTNCTIFDPKEIRGRSDEGYETEEATCRLGEKPGYGDFLFYKSESMRREMSFRLFGSVEEVESVVKDELLTKFASFEEAKAAL